MASSPAISPQDSLRDIGRRFYAAGWSVGTSSNYSVVIARDPLQLLITASGKDKGQLAANDFVQIGANGQPTHDGQPAASAEAALHVAIAADPHVGCVLHTHSVWGTVLSNVYAKEGVLKIAGYEMLKGLEGITTHDITVGLKIFENTQNIPALAKTVGELRASGDPTLNYGLLLRNHGLYTWGRDVDACRRHVEVLEFLMQVIGRRLSIGS